MPWTTANGVSLHYQLAGDRGPAVVLLHEMGGTLESWDGVTPGLAAQFRVLRYDQRGAGLSEKVRAQFTNDDAVDDLEGVLKNLEIKPPYNFVCVAAASTQVLRFLERHPDQVASIVLCNPAPGVDPSRAGAERPAGRALDLRQLHPVPDDQAPDVRDPIEQIRENEDEVTAMNPVDQGLDGMGQRR